MTADHIDRAAEVMIEHTRTRIEGCHCGWSRLGASHAEHVAQALADAGLLATDERAEVLAEFTEEWAVASDIAATVIPMPPTLARKVAALGVDARVVRRHVGPWEPVAGDEP